MNPTAATAKSEADIGSKKNRKKLTIPNRPPATMSAFARLLELSF